MKNNSRKVKFPEIAPRKGNVVNFPTKHAANIQKPFVSSNVKGFEMRNDSLKNVGIFQGNIVIAEPISEPADIFGKLCVVELHKENTVICRRLLKNKKGIFELRAENSDYDSYFLAEQDFTILGIVNYAVKTVK